MFRLAPLALLGALLCLGGCSSSLTKLDMFVTASNSLNPDLGGRPSPIVVRLIELRHPAAFENTDFFALYQNPRQALAPDFVTQEEFELLEGVRWNTAGPPEEAYLRMKGARSLKGRQLAVLRALFEWRERVAAQLDRAQFRILHNDTLLTIAKDVVGLRASSIGASPTIS